MKRHVWTKWRLLIQRCSRPGCEALRSGIERRRYSTDGGKTWYSVRPECTGKSTADKEA